MSETPKKRTIYDVFDVAAYCISRGKFPCFELQKLLYYCQALSLAERGVPLFYARTIKGTCGPIVPTVNAAYSINGSQAIANNPKTLLGNVTTIQAGEDLDFLAKLDKLIAYANGLDANELSLLSHNDGPWKKHINDEIGNGKPEVVFTWDDLRSYFKGRPEAFQLKKRLRKEFPRLSRKEESLNAA